MSKKSISIEQLLANGWVNTNSTMMPIEKKIENRNPLNASEDSNIKLVVHGMYNAPTFAILLPDGGMINFVVNCLKELKDFERRIDFYDPPF